MKPCSWIICFFCAVLSAGCVVAPSRVEAQPQPPVVAGPPDALEQLVAPIALYPDALIAIILPASTATTDVALAARYLDAGGDPNDVDSRAWDDSVKSLAHYPELVHWMNENLEWAEELGSAYLDQPDDVMAAIQRARARAMANGTLVSTSEQQVVVEDGYIRVIPAQPDVIYVPRYDPEIIFVDQPPDFFPGPLITWGPAFGVGFWLSYDCDWGHRSIWHDPHPREHWRDHHDWRHREWHGPGGNGPAHSGWHQWHPAPGRRPPSRHHLSEPHREVRQPRPPQGAPHFDRTRVRTSEHRENGGHREDTRHAPPAEHRPEPSHVAPRRPGNPSDHRAVPPAREREHEPTPDHRRAEHHNEPQRAPVPPPQPRREEERKDRRDNQPDARATPPAAVPPSVRRVTPPPRERHEIPAAVHQAAPAGRPEPARPERREEPRVIVPPAVRRGEPARDIPRANEPSRPVQQRGAPPVQHAPPAQRAAPVQRAAPRPAPPPPPPHTEQHQNGNNGNQHNDRDRPDDRRDARDH